MRTRKPCLGCGDSENFRVSAASLCDVCKGDLKVGAASRERAEKGTFETLSVPESAHWLPYLSQSGDYGITIQRALCDLILLLGKPTAYSSRTKKLVHADSRHRAMRSEYNTWLSPTVELPQGTQEIIQRLFGGIYDALVHAHGKGHKEGRNLLYGLADGKLTIVEFNERTVGLGG